VFPNGCCHDCPHWLRCFEVLLGAANNRLQCYIACPPVAISESLTSLTIWIRNDQEFLFFLKTNAYIHLQHALEEPSKYEDCLYIMMFSCGRFQLPTHIGYNLHSWWLGPKTKFTNCGIDLTRTRNIKSKILKYRVPECTKPSVKYSNIVVQLAELTVSGMFADIDGCAVKT